MAIWLGTSPLEQVCSLVAYGVALLLVLVNLYVLPIVARESYAWLTDALKGEL